MRYQLVLTKFHADDGSDSHPSAVSTLPRAVVSSHRSRETAEAARRKRLRGSDCTCGCYVVVEREAAPVLAYVGTIGSNAHTHRWFESRDDAEEWLACEFRRQRETYQGVPTNEILSFRQAERVTYRSGAKVFGYRDHGNFVPDNAPVPRRR